LQFFQQEDYTSSRFIEWYKNNKAFDRQGSWTALGTSGACYAAFFWSLPPWVSLVLSLLGTWLLFVIASREENPFTSGKIKLKMTARAKRITYTAMALYVAFGSIVFFLCFHFTSWNTIAILWQAQILLFQSCPLWLVIANELLAPYERSLQEGFANEARALIKKYDPAKSTILS
jgi:hypothetical protein